MRLRNKKTGEIATLTLSSNGEELLLMKNNKMVTRNVKLSDLDEWKDMSEEPQGIQCIYYVNHFDAAKIDGVIIGFETKEEADFVVEELKAWKRLKDAGFRFEGWWVTEGRAIEIGARFNKTGIKKDLDLLFGGDDD